MAKKYGNTWWGQKWLSALYGIDYSNRLPRGKTYANKGAVQDFRILKVNRPTVQTKVRGSRPEPYTQVIRLKPYQAKEREKILDLIKNNPLILSRLLNRELPKELYEALHQNRIGLFPQKWEELEADCSCPDWAVPCKHLAAVMYTLANEIDQNPFLVFQLRGLDILEELEKLGFSFQGQSLQIPELANYFQEQPPALGEEWEEGWVSQIDFSKIPESKNTLLKMLQEEPLFYGQRDFKKYMEDAYKIVAKQIDKFLEPRLDFSDQSWETDLDRVQVIIDSNFRYRQTKISQQHQIKAMDTQQDMQQLIQALQNLPRHRLFLYAPPIIALYLNYQFAIHLLKKSAYVPQIIQLKEGKYIIRWIPALLIPEVRELFDLLVNISPPETLILLGRQFTRYPKAEEQVRALVSLFLNYFINEFCQNPRSYQYDETFAAFFNQLPIETQNFDKREQVPSIYQWLQKFYLSEKDIVPIVKVEEEEIETEKPQFSISLWVQDRRQAWDNLIALRDVFAQEKYQDIRLEVLKDMALLREYFPLIEEIIQSQGEEHVQLDAQDFVAVIQETIPALQLLNISVILPKSLHKILKPKLSLQLSAQEGQVKKDSWVGMEQLLDFDWQIALGDALIAPQVFLQKVKDLEGLVKIRNQYVLLNQEEIQSLVERLEKTAKLSPKELIKASLSEAYKTAQVHLDEKARQLLQDLRNIEEVALPEHLQATLRPYQARGYAWLYKNAQLGFGSLLADDMGLGKTLQCIAFLLKMQEEAHLANYAALIIVPTTLLNNWQREIQKFAPSLQTAIYHGAQRTLDFRNKEVIITTYGIVRSDIEDLRTIPWAMIVIDEAQNIKNPSTAQTKAVKKLEAPRLIALSGTPVENRLSEYWSILDFANRGYLGTLTRFKDEFIKPIEAERNQQKLMTFRKITEPFILRRLKSDSSIIQDLPEKIESNQICNLSSEQVALYQSVVDHMLREIEQREGIARKGAVLQMITALKQICNHPAHYLKQEEIDPDLSGKTQMLISLLDSIYENGEKTLIFTQYRKMGDLLAQLIHQRYHQAPLWLHGSLNPKQRDQMVEDFQNKGHIKTMILSLKAAGTGLTLTQANHVIHYDFWWNPAVEQQATDRAYRIGQKKNVWIYRLLTQGTFEEKINEMLQAKKELADLTVVNSEQWIGDLDNQDLKEIFQLNP